MIRNYMIGGPPCIGCFLFGLQSSFHVRQSALRPTITFSSPYLGPSTNITEDDDKPTLQNP